MVACSFWVFLALELCVILQAADRFGLTHSCTGANECEGDRLFCIDADATGDVCVITCGIAGVAYAYDSCADATIVVANSGGLQLNCESNNACVRIEVNWANSGNLATYQSLNADSAIGGALHSLSCTGYYGCQDIEIYGQMQQQSLDVVTDWNCANSGACHIATAKLHSVSLQCAGNSECCRFTRLTCLSGGNCETTAIDSDSAFGASLTCQPLVQSCICSPFFTCITLTAAPVSTTTVLPLTTAKEVSTTKTVTSTTKESTTSKPSTTQPMSTTTLTATDPSSSTPFAEQSSTPVKETTKRTTTSKSTTSTNEEYPTTQKPNATTEEWTGLTSTTPKTTESNVSGAGNNGQGFSLLIVVAAIAGCVLLICILSAVYYWWRKRKLAKAVAEIKLEKASAWIDNYLGNINVDPNAEIHLDESGSQPPAPENTTDIFLPTDTGGAMPKATVELQKVVSHSSVCDAYSEVLDAGYSTLKKPKGDSRVKVTVMCSDTGEDEIEDTGEGQRGEGKGNGSDTRLKKVVFQMKMDAKTAEDKSVVRILDLALSAEPYEMEDELQTLVQMGVGTERIIELLFGKAQTILRLKGITLTKATPTAKEPTYVCHARDEQREDSEELYDAGFGIATHGATVMGTDTLEALIAKKQLAAYSGEEKGVAKKLRMALTMAPAKMEEAYRALLQMGANTDEIVLILADTAGSILGADL